MTTSSAAPAAAKAPRCGVCDTLEAPLICSACGEPVCEGHAVGVGSPPRTICLACFQEGKGLEGAILARRGLAQLLAELR